MTASSDSQSINEIQQLCAQVLQHSKICMDSLQSLQKDQEALLQECGVDMTEFSQPQQQ